MTEREQARADFLSGAGWGEAELISMGQDASTRSYMRLAGPMGNAILMDAPPSSESAPCGPDASEYDRIIAGWNARTRLAACRVDAFVGVAEHLRALDLSAPTIIAYDVEQGFAIIEDLGNGVFAREIEAGQDERELYLVAIDALAKIHNTPAPETVTAGSWVWPILAYDRLAMTTGADLFPKWYPAYDTSVRFSGDLARHYDDIIAGLSDHLASLPKVLMMRDYHAENLLWMPERDGLAKVGILDFQDAVRGPAAWDIAMFVQDARRDVSPELQQEVVQRYVQLAGLKEDDFYRDLAIAGAVNALRILGVFARLITRDGKPRYEQFMEREWGHLEDCFVHPALAELKAVMAQAVPGRKRLQ